MFGIERLQAIREFIKEKKVVEVAYLSKELNVSGVTIRRDLDKLEKEGLVAKTYGGAILIEDGVVIPEKFMAEAEANVIREGDQKLLAIAKTAAKIIGPGDTVFVGGSAMGIALVKCLKECEGLIVVTDNIEIAMYIYKETEHKVVIIGGELDTNTGNALEFDQLDELLIEKSFITADGIDEQVGYTVNEKRDVRLFQKLQKVSRNLILVAPSDIYNKRGLVKMASLSSIPNVVSDKEIPDSFKSYYFENSIQVHTSMLNIVNQ